MGCLKIAIADDNENMLRALGQVINGESDMNLVVLQLTVKTHMIL